MKAGGCRIDFRNASRSHGLEHPRAPRCTLKRTAKRAQNFEVLISPPSSGDAPIQWRGTPGTLRRRRRELWCMWCPIVPPALSHALGSMFPCQKSSAVTSWRMAYGARALSGGFGPARAIPVIDLVSASLFSRRKYCYRGGWCRWVASGSRRYVERAGEEASTLTSEERGRRQRKGGTEEIRPRRGGILAQYSISCKCR